MEVQIMSRRTLPWVFVTALILLTVSGCSLFTTILGESDRGTIQELSVGDLLQIRLPGTASTGYEWVRIAPESLAGGPVESEGEGEYCSSSSPLAGAPGEFTFRYRALRPGTVVLTYAYRRSWESEEPAETYSVTVWVR
jgi:predicted secreted protein